MATMAKLTITYSEMKTIPMQLWPMHIIDRLLKAGAPIKVKRKASFIFYPLMSDDDIEMLDTMTIVDDWKHGLERHYIWKSKKPIIR